MRTAADLRIALDTALDGHPSKIVIDLAAVTFMDSTGLGVLASARNRAGDNGRVGRDQSASHRPAHPGITGLRDLFTDAPARDQDSPG